jgi:hypothetical protein
LGGINVSSGDITIGTVARLARVDIRSGSVAIGEVLGAEDNEVVIDVSSGSLTVGKAAFSKVEVRLSSGNVKLFGLQTPVLRMNVSSGGLEIKTAYQKEQILLNVSKSSGTVKFFGNKQTSNVVGSPLCTITGSVSSGSIDIS